ncbi:zinc ABC transporter substrate-binding protein AdcA [Streptococcus loxodontisalivarius]|uniref:Zinc transport system substrate-binding protein n=1 Tax=Streptococcus loxodontisalivarius TaxID=1349415 RepID=A0ABS2PQ54_9STRE|nr:zinc ABC transporter substrate-binding protein AdcA [Streptococcus loxodontisalivarius]MBM7642167.1 zinc transport system substrate-binding protein [Streptococcus loxodontisalivarius]
MKKKLIAGLATVAVLAGAAYVWQSYQTYQAQKGTSSGKLEVVTTFYPVYEFTKSIVGDEGNVEMLIGAGTEVHDFQPTTKQIAQIEDADAFVYMDSNLETWVSDVTSSVDSKKTAVIKSTGDMLLMAGSEEEGHDEGEAGHTHAYDPHVWLSPSRSVTLVENIRDGLIKKYPKYKDTFTKNAAAYIDKLQELSDEYTTALSAAKQTSFVTQHAAFGYLALDYGLTQIPITGVSADSEPSAQRLASLATYVKDNEIKYIYFEENASAKVAQTLADEAGVKTAVLNPLESLTTQEIKDGEDYFSVMRENLKNLQLTTDVAGKTIQAEEDTTKTVANGYFEDADVTNRSLSDWTGEWQSVYPYLLDGTLDEVWDYKSKLSKGAKTAAEYKEYYTTGYKTDIEKINIDGEKNTVEFIQNGTSHKFTYKYVGYKILTYEKGNRGVRYLFETDDANAGEFKYIQFSDHNISETDSAHFHLFWGSTSQDEILKEMDNWPTYYPADLTGHEIAQEIVAH